MSRSYRKFAVCREHERRVRRCFRQKTMANRRVRRSGAIPGGKCGYRRLFEQWRLSDYRLIGCSDEKEVRRGGRCSRGKWDIVGRYPADPVRAWRKYYKRK